MHDIHYFPDLLPQLEITLIYILYDIIRPFGKPALSSLM